MQGVLPGWWLGEDDDRSQEPYISPSRWDEELRNAGFSGADTILDQEAPFQTTAGIVARPLRKPIASNRVTLLIDKGLNSHRFQAEAVLGKSYDIDVCSLDQTPPPNQDVISLLDLNNPFFDSLSAERLEAIVAIMKKLDHSGLLWLTKAAQVNSTDPRYAQTLGVIRTMRSELAIDLATLEIDHLANANWNCVGAVFDKFARRTQGGEMNPEYEYALSDGNILISRFHWFSVTKELSVVPQGHKYKKLQIRKRGFLKTLYWAERPLPNLTGDQVQVKVRAAGMNFKVCPT